MVTQPPTRATAYETWVHTLRAWTTDPSVRLDHLPQLEDDTYTPDTYARLFEYVSAALAEVTKRWGEALLAASARARDPHELSRELHQLRPLLARRVQLARLPAHPPGVRTILEEDLQATVARLQAELEESVRRQSDRARLDHATLESMLRVVRDNPFTAVLGYRVNERGDIAAPALRTLTPSANPRPTSRWSSSNRSSASPPPVSRRPVRRVMPDPDQEV